MELAEVGDARALSAADDSVDAAVLLGPLYHLTDRDDRLRALSEARRVVRPGGVVAVAVISRFASLFSGLESEYLFDPEFFKIVRGDLADGVHRNPTGHPAWFTTAFFHRPEERGAEIAEAGLAFVDLIGLEGMALWLPHLASRCDDEADRELLLASARLVESEPTLLGLSAHLLAIGNVPAQ